MKEPMSGVKVTETRGNASSESGISPDLVRQVADRVYAMLRRDLQIERERHGFLPAITRGDRARTDD